MARNTDSLVVPFGAEQSSSSNILFEEDYKRSEGYAYHLRVYTRGREVLIRATIGEITRLGKDSREVRREGLVFSGSDTAALRYPCTLFGSARLEGAVFNATGQATSATLRYDHESNSVIASQPIYGVATVDYAADYERLGYEYEREQYSLGLFDGQTVYAMRWFAGTVYAFDQYTVPPSISAFPIPDYELNISDGPQDTVELWRKVSYVQVTDVGVYERHAGWPEQTFIPADYDGYVVDVERSHEVAYMDKLGRLFENSYEVEVGLPYTSPTGEYPITSTKYASMNDPSQTWGSSSLLTEATNYIRNNQG